jgi:NAD(P)H-dependent FMN reductase
MSTLKITLIVGSTRGNRFSEKVAQWMMGEAGKRKDLDVELLDLRDYPLPFFEQAIPPGLQGPKGYDDPAIRKWQAKVINADGFIVCTPEYNHGYPAVLKNALDHVYYDWNRKAMAFVSWGGAGGARGVEQLRLVAIELGLAPVRPAVHIASPWFIKDASELKTEANERAATVLLDDLTWWTRALKTARESGA